MASAIPVLPDDGSMMVLPGREHAVRFGILDHLPGDAILHRSRRVLALDLGQDADVGIGTEVAHVQERRLADHVDDGCEHGHAALQRVPTRVRELSTELVKILAGLGRDHLFAQLSVVDPIRVQNGRLVAQRHDHVVPVRVDRLGHIGRRRVRLGVGV